MANSGNNRNSTVQMQRDQNVLKPIISIILPMHEHRGMAVEALESWLNQQDCQPDEYELILINDDTLLDVEPTLRQKLRTHDQLISSTSRNFMEHYNLGVEQARGDFLFFTEPHCTAEPRTVAEIIRYIQTHEPDGFCGRSIPICPNRLAEINFRMFDKGFHERIQENHWGKVILRTFGIRRNVYRDVGGFEYEYGPFAELLLGATLNTKGYQLGYAADIVVRHLEPESFHILEDYMKDYIPGECRYRLEHSTEFCEQFFGSPPKWNEARASDETLMLNIRHALWQQVRKHQGASSTHLGWNVYVKYLLSILPTALFGRHWLLFRSQLSVWLAKIRCYLWWRLNEERMYHAFFEYYTGMASLLRVQFALKHLNLKKKIQSPPVRLSYAIGDMDIDELFGFHGLELYQGTRFRWSSSVAALKIHIEPDHYTVTVQLNGARPMIPEQELSIFLNSFRIDQVNYDFQRHTLAFSLPKDVLLDTQEQWLLFFCVPWRANDIHVKDRRSLGMPIVSVQFKNI